MEWTPFARVASTMFVVGALFLPVVRNQDSFPLSTHPMYATARDRDETLVSAVGLTESGDIIRLSLSLVASTDDPLVAESFIERALRDGHVEETCRDIANRVADAAEHANAVDIAIVSERVDLVDFVESGTVRDRTIHLACPVPR